MLVQAGEGDIYHVGAGEFMRRYDIIGRCAHCSHFPIGKWLAFSSPKLPDPHELDPLSHYIIDTACTAGCNKELEACLEQKRKDYAEALPVHRFLIWAAASCSQAMKQFAVIVLKKKLRREQLQPLAYLHVNEGGKRGVGHGGSSTGGSREAPRKTRILGRKQGGWGGGPGARGQLASGQGGPICFHINIIYIYNLSITLE